MTLSIITINYNNAEGLRKTLASVASQTYAEIEHIIIDGGSTDESVEILEAYPQPLPKRRGEITEDKFPTQNPVHKVIWITRQNYYNCARRKGDKKGRFLRCVAKKCIFSRFLLKTGLFLVKI